MPEMRRFSEIVLLSVCLIGSAQGAQGAQGAQSAEAQQFAANQLPHLVVGEETLRAMAVPVPASFGSTTLAQRGWNRRGRGNRNGVASAEMVLGAVGMIAGAAVLTYANRPECSVSALNNGCSYGSKVAGASLAAAGAVSFLAGAITWR